MKISISVNLEMTEVEGLKIIEEEYKPHSIKPKKNNISNNNIRNMIAKEVDRQLRNQMNSYSQFANPLPIPTKNR